MKRHLGRMANTDQRIVVVYMQIPGKLDHALIVPIDNLPAQWEQYVMEVLDSKEGQGEENLGEILGRRLVPESKETIFQALHNSGVLQAVPVDNIIMYPAPNQPYPLRKILESMGRLSPKTDAETQKFNPHASNQDADIKQDASGIANNLLTEAALLEEEAQRKRERAFSYAPHLRAQYEKSNKKTITISETSAPLATETAKTTKVSTKAIAAKKAPAKKTTAKA